MSDLYFETHVFCCINEREQGHKRGSCAGFGSEKLQKYMKARAKELGITDIRVNKSGCLDRCELGPVLVVYPQGIWYHYKTTDDIDEILQNHIIDGRIVERLLLKKDQVTLEKSA